MRLPQYLQRLYSLDTLDTRLTNSKSSSATKAEARRSKWKTPEFYFYYIVIFVAIPQMFMASYDASKDTHPGYSKFEHLLSSGWIPGRKVDNSDAQYAGFRDNIPYMVLLLMLHPCLRRLYNIFNPASGSPRPSGDSSPAKKSNGHIAPLSTASAANARLEQRLSFDLYFALVYLCALHGFSALKILLILYSNFMLATRLPKSFVPAATWIFNIGILFANELCGGYKFTALAQPFLPVSVDSKVEADKQTSWGTWLDSHGGVIPRWEILFNITVLRLISFNLDYYWSIDKGSASPIEKKQLDPAALSERDRVALPAAKASYSLRNYLSYTLYSPLYLTGPILTFNDYISQARYPLSSLTVSRTAFYAVRFLFALLCMEVMIHYIYTVAISKSNPNWEMYSPFQLSMLGFFHLHHIWLKLLLPWRFFRLWALIDDVDAPENMVRCMSNNYSTLAFWRAWHRSFNRWIVRYIYVPLGGSGARSASASESSLASKFRPVVNMLIVFTFVALWHDINLRLLMWGWLVTLFVLPEVIATILFPKRKWASSPTAYRVICGIGAVGNVLMMMAANLVGFAVGIDGLKDLVSSICGSWSGLAFLAIACSALFVGAQVMFEIREDEAREGIRLNC